jgi:hypothetical protein
MPDPQIRVGITATTDAAEVKIAQAYQKMASASLELQNVQSRHTDILKNYRTSALDAATASTFLSENLREQSEAVAKLTAAKLELKAASVSQIAVDEQAAASASAAAVATEAAGAAASHTVPQMGAASGALRELSGNFDHNIRAAERFLATTLGLGPILQAAFPVVGALAMAGVLFDLGEKVAKFSEEAGALGRELGTGWLDGAIAEVSGLGKAFKQTDDELLKLAGDRDRLRGRAESIDVETARLEKQAEVYKRLTANLGPENPQNRQAYSKAAAQAQQEGNRAGDEAEIANLQKKITALEQIKRLNIQAAEDLGKRAASQVELDRGGSIGIADLRKQQELATSQYKTALAEQIVLIKEKNNLELKSEISGQKEGRVSVARVPKENYADELAAKQLADGKSLGETVLYWEAVVEKTGKYHEQLLRAEEAFYKNLNEKGKFAEKLKKDEIKEEPKAISAQGADVGDKLSEYYDHTGEAYAHYRDEVAKGNQVLTENAEKLGAIRVQLAEQTGALTRVQADHALGALKAKEYADRIAELRAQMAALKADLPKQEAEGKGGEAAAEIQRLQNQVYALSGQAAAAAAANQGKTTQDIAAPFIRGIDSINSAWLSMQNKLIFGTRNVSQAFANMGVSMLESVAASFEKMLARQLQFEIQSIIAHQTANTTKVASDATAAAAGSAINTTSALKENFINAKVAATGAFKGVMTHVPPPLNYILAPVAAAAAFAGTLAVGAFAKGGLITAPTLALMGEAGTEAVLPNKLTNLLLNVANGGGGPTTSNSSSFSQTNNFHGATDREFKNNLRKHSSTIADAVGRELRGGRRP